MSERLSKARRRLIVTARWVLNYWAYLLIPYIAAGIGLYYWANNYLDVIVWVSGADASGGWKHFMLSFVGIPVLLLAVAYWFVPLVAVVIMYAAWRISGRKSGSLSMKGYLDKLSQ
ncbi:hypothetical protein [Paenibacillus sp. YPG26]|uniref:hypothetical protein n=1 Tax=Paenibacillus sp. YPG26 TaxID=2878915 RepID=UPI00203FB791|nr:hypothetical protein [Paenibacillus sp. YPG26]USB33368.1 hypothetical protein LDO05_00540 [Paenibacillus sp. YPG26]